MFSKLNKLHTRIDDFLSLPIHVYLKDIRGMYRECNLAQAKSFGVNKGNDVIGHKDIDYLNKKESHTLRMNDIKVISHETPDIFIEHATFSALPPSAAVLSYKIPARSRLGKVIGLFGISFPLFLEETTSKKLFFHEVLFNDINMLDYSKKSFPPAMSHITKRETECLHYLMKGMKTKEIAAQLNLSPRTIEFYLEKLKKKWRCTNKAELILKAYKIITSNFTY